MKFIEKIQVFQKKGADRSGIILIIVLWILVILSALAIGLSRKTSVDMQLTKYALGQLKARYAAMAGIQYARGRILEAQYLAGQTQTTPDTKYQCGFRLKNEQSPEDLFRQISIGEDYFDIYYVTRDLSSPETMLESVRYGFSDEESKINLNALTANNYEILVRLIVILGYDEETAQQVASSLIDWRDADDAAFNESYGAENSYYASLDTPYSCKNGPLDNLEEVLLLKGVTPEMFRALSPYITIFPSQGRFVVNLNTASRTVLLALAQAYVGGATNTEREDADSLVEKLFNYRQGEDGLGGTEDDRKIDLSQIPLTAKERTLAFRLNREKTEISRYLRVEVKGVSQPLGIEARAQAIIFREDASVVFWSSQE